MNGVRMLAVSRREVEVSRVKKEKQNRKKW